MTARGLQPSEYEIQREVEALRDIRRRSTTPGALTIDPDLPNQSPPSSPTSSYWSPKPKSPDSNSVGSFQEADSSSRASSSSHSDEALNPNDPADDPFHLFWVPASVHPEIAPAEFRAFLKEHARSPSDGADVSLSRTSSLSSRSSLSRQRSKLSRQYQPKEGDGIETEEKIVPLRRNRSYAQNPVPQLTISDLQRLEELAEEASESDDPSRLRNVLRRSLSLNLSPTAIEQMDGMPEMGDEADVPIIVPPPGQILRRAARTKIRKPGLPGENAPHRFGASRRGPRTSSERRTSGEALSNEGDSDGSSSRRHTVSDDGTFNQRPDSFSEEASIFDAYARDDDEDMHPSPIVVTSAPEPERISSPHLPELPQFTQPEVQPSLLEALGPILDLQQPQPKQLLTPQPPNEQELKSSRTPSPLETVPEAQVPSPSNYPPVPFQPQPVFPIVQPQQTPQQQPPQQQPPPHILAPIPQQAQPVTRKEKEKDKDKEKDRKGLFSIWGGDKGAKKGKGQENRASEKEGFFGSLFGSKKKQDDFSSSITNSAGREAAQALLGASKSKNHVPPSSPGLAPGVSNFSRYPIHVERAIYRLSHIKLANPRRPLYEQVLISNLMFWYLGVINKAQNPTAQPSGDASGTQNEKEEREKEQKEKEQKEKAEKERLERERLEKEQKERELEMKKKESGRRGSLTKTPVGGPVTRRAEMPVKGPQYEMQQQVMQKEYNNGYNGPRNPNQPPMAMNGPNGQPYARSPVLPQGQPFPPQGAPQYPPSQGQPYPVSHPQQYPPSQMQQYPNSPPRLVQPQLKPQGPPENYYYQHDTSQQRPGLPPGAMPPAGISPPPPHVQSRSPPPQNFQPQPQQHRGPYSNNTSQESISSGPPRSPARSLSATAVPSQGGPPTNGNLRKGHSAHAVAPYDPKIPPNRRPRTSEGKRGPSEEEDMPLAVYQQQQRK